MYGPAKPYSMVKSPSVQYLVPESHQKGRSNVQPHGLAYGDRSTIERLAQAQALAAPSPDNTNRSDYNPVSGYEGTQDLRAVPRPYYVAPQTSHPSEDDRHDRSPLTPCSSNVGEVLQSVAIPGRQPQAEHTAVVQSRNDHNDAFPGFRVDVAQLERLNSKYSILVPNQRGGKRGPFKDPSLREQTAQTRKMGSCIRCRMQRIRVSGPPWHSVQMLLLAPGAVEAHIHL
jgi:hypothetical protein